MAIIELSGEIWQEGNMYSAYCHELDVATAGHTLEEARSNLSEALGIYFEETARKGTLRGLLEEGGFSVGNLDQPGIILSSRSKFRSFEKIEVELAEV